MSQSLLDPFALALALGVLAGGIAACSEVDDSRLSNTLAPHAAASRSASADAGRSSAATTNAPDGGVGPSAPLAAAAPAPTTATAPTTAFTGAAAFAEVTPSDESANHHGGDSNAGKDCLSCHTGEGAPQFVIGGTVFATKAGVDGAPGVQVRVVGGAGGPEIAVVGTDSAGNFWLEGTTQLPPGTLVGVRDAVTTQGMIAAPSTGSCNQTSCHVGTRPLFLAN